MKKAIQEFHQWVKSHPYKACLFAALTAALGAWDGTRPYLKWIDLFPWALFLAVVALVIHWDSKGLSYLLIAAFLCQPHQARATEQKQPAGAGAACGVVVILVGGYVIYRLAKACDRMFPRTPKTNNPPAVVWGAQHSYALATSCSTVDTCYTTPSSLMGESNSGTVLEISGYVDELPQGGLGFIMIGAKRLNTNDLVTLNEFQQDLWSWGVRFGSVGEVSYGIDGEPCAPDQVPITVTFNGANPMIDVSDPSWEHVALTIERSPDLLHWEPFLSMTVNVGQRMSFSDASNEGQMFYRGRTVMGD